MSDAGEAGLSPGTMVGAYRIERKLGQGGFGAVYAAEEPTIKKRVAIKVLKRSVADEPSMMARFQREARAANEIRHPNIVDVFAFGSLPDGRPYLVMSLLEGRSLKDEIRARQSLPPAEAWRIAREVALALGAAHEAGIIHRDLKPDNVFLERFGQGDDATTRVRVLDFGIAKFEEPEDGEASKLTATGVPVGTPAYMAPEQWRALRVTAQTDQYALGGMLFEMLTGRTPFAAPSFIELGQKHSYEPPPSLAERGAPVPAAVEGLVARMLAKKPEERFPSMRALIDEGDRAFGGPGSQPSPASPGATAGRPDPTPVAARTAPSSSGLGRGPSPEDPIAIAQTEIAARPSAALVPAPSAGRALGRYLALHAAVIVAGAAALVAVGYAGEGKHDPVEWYRSGGGGQNLIVAWIPVAVIGLALVARRRAATAAASLAGFWLALLPALAGALATYTDWRTVLRFMEGSKPLVRLALFSEGTLESNAPRFLGFALASFFCLSLSALPGVSGMASATHTLAAGPGVRRREAVGTAIGLAILAAAAVWIDAPSGALVAGTCAVALLLGAALPTVNVDTAARDEMDRAIAAVLAVLLMTAVGVTRLEAREAALWSAGLTRAARIDEILAAARERDATLPIAAVSLLAIAAVEGLRIRRLVRLGAVRRPRAGTATLATVLALAVAGDIVLHGRFAAKRDELRADIATQFAFFRSLDPPRIDESDPEKFVPHKTTALQITRDVVAVDGHGVARVAAVASPEGAAQVAAELNHALAKAGLDDALPAEVDLALTVDREVPGATLLRLLRLARGAGVRRVEVLFTRGDPPKLAAGDPPEAGIALPSDFAAVPAELGDDGIAVGEGESFGQVAPRLIEAARSGPVRIAVRAGAGG